MTIFKTIMRLFIDLLFRLPPLKAIEVEQRVALKYQTVSYLSKISMAQFLAIWNLYAQWYLLVLWFYLPQQMKFGTGLLRDLHETKIFGTFYQAEFFIHTLSWIGILVTIYIFSYIH